MGLDIEIIIGPIGINLSQMDLHWCDCEKGDTSCCGGLWPSEDDADPFVESEKAKLRQFRGTHQFPLTRNNHTLASLIAKSEGDYHILSEALFREIFQVTGCEKMTHDVQMLREIYKSVNFETECVWALVSY